MFLIYKCCAWGKFIVIFEHTRQQNESHETVNVAKTPKAKYLYRVSGKSAKY